MTDTAHETLAKKLAHIRTRFGRDTKYSRLLVAVASEILPDFPRKLPNDLRDMIQEDLNAVNDALVEIMGAPLAKGHPLLERPSQGPYMELVGPIGGQGQIAFVKLKSEIGKLVQQIFVSEFLVRGTIKPIPIAKFVLQQQYVFVYSAFEAAVLDQVAECLRSDIRILKTTSRTMSFEEALSFKSIEQLKEFAIDRYLSKFSRMDWSERENELRSFFLSDPGVNQKVSETLKKFEMKRHLLVHTGGVVTLEMVARHRELEGQQGKVIGLSSEELNEAIDTANIVMSNITDALARKFAPSIVVKYGTYWQEGQDHFALG